MTKTKEFLQQSFQPGDPVCITYINGQECCGIVDQFLPQSVILRRTDGSSQFIDYGIIGTFEKSAERQLHYRLRGCLEQKKSVVLTTKNGVQISGVPVELDEKVICIRGANGLETMVMLDYIGMFTVGTATAAAPVSVATPAVVSAPAAAAPAQSAPAESSAFAAPAPRKLTAADRLLELSAPLEQAKMALNALQARLREDGTLAGECNAKLNSLQNAIKINEYEAKYQRTPRILAELIQVTNTYYASVPLLSIIGEVALMAGGNEERSAALECFSVHWDRLCANDENLLRLLAVLCEQQGSAAVLTDLTAKWCRGAELPYLRAMAHYAVAVAAVVPEDVFSDNDTAICCRKLFELLTNTDFGAAEAAKQPEPVQIEADMTEEAAPLPPLAPGERCGKITLFIPANGFGVITDTEGHTYSFVTHNMSIEEAARIRYGAVVYFYKGLQPRYNKKKQQYVDIAEMIRVMADADDAELPKPSTEPEFPANRCTAENMADKEIGYVMLFRTAVRSGYICHEMNYGVAERGNIFFEQTDMDPEMPLDTYHYHYKVAFNYVNGLPRRATNVVVLERLPKPEAAPKEPVVLPLAEDEYHRLQFCQGETMLVERKQDENVFGRFVSFAEDVLTLENDGQQTAIPVGEIKELFFAGVVTHYMTAALSGKVNGQYPFRIHNVIGTEPDRILKQGGAASMPCLYSLRLHNGELRVHKLRAFDESLLQQLPWQEGTVAGAYRPGTYFTVDEKIRCHAGTFGDAVTTGWMQQQDFLRQAVLYRCVYHKSAEPGVLARSAVQVIAKQQLADVVSPLGVDGLRLQCPMGNFEAPGDLSGYDLGQQLRVTFALDAQGALTVTEMDAENLTLPTYAAVIAEEKQALEQAMAEAEAAQDMAKVAEIGYTMLRQAMLPPDKGMELIYHACLRCNDETVFRQAMESHGYLLPNVVRMGYRMQLQCLSGDQQAACSTALTYLSANASDPNTIAIARELAKSALDREALRTHVLEKRAFADDRCAGRIGLFNPITRQGNIQWAKGKLNFSYKDFVDLSDDDLDLQRYDYFVTFRVDESHHVPKAANVELLYRKEKTMQ